MKLWKCYNCADHRGIPGRDFFAEAPVCPHCGADRNDPRAKNIIVQCRLVHLDTPHPILKNRGTGTLACGATRTADTRMTGETQAVTCPKCLGSEAFLATAAKQHPTDDEFEAPNDFRLTVDAANQQYVKAGG